MSDKYGFKEKVAKLKDSLKDYPNVKVVAATKYMDIDQTRALVEAGIKDIGENRTDMFLEKYEALKDLDVNWHFLGTVQSRKVRDIVGKIDCLHSLDKLATAMELDSRLTEDLDCFIQVNVTDDPSKAGVNPAKVISFVKSLGKCKNIKIVGLMCIAKMTFEDDVLEAEFKKLKKLQTEVEALNLEYAPCHELSMGMTNDYEIALKCGATVLRLGHIFLD